MPSKKLEEHIIAVLSKMLEEAQEDVWTGKMTELVASVAPPSYYARIVRVLAESGLVEQLQRGGGSSPSVWRILWDGEGDLSSKLVTETLLRKRRDAIEARVAALEAHVGGVDISRALVDLTNRLTTVEGMLKDYVTGVKR